MDGQGGNDWLEGMGGDDTLNGGADDDILDGGSDTDTADYSTAAGSVTVDLSLAGSQNTLGAGSDTLISIENLIGSSQADTLYDGSGANIVYGGGGADTVYLRSGGDTYYAALFDGGVVYASTDTDTIDCGYFAQLNFSPAASGVVVDSTTGQYVHIGTVTGSTHDDTFVIGSYWNGGDVLFGGGGFDTVSYAGLANSLSIDANTSAPVGGVYLNGISGFIATNFDDTFIGSDGANYFDGAAGDDAVTGGSSDDVLGGSAGDDAISAGSGADTVNGGADADSLNGGSGVDTLNGDAGSDSLNGGSGDDLMDGGADDDHLKGSDGNDTIYGGAGFDTLSGGAGNDVLIGGLGQDVLVGGSGADTFVFAASGDSTNNEPDTVKHFAAADTIDLSDIDAVPGAGDDPFAIVAVFDGHAGQLVLSVHGAKTTLSLDIDGDAFADATSVVKGTLPGLGDFVL